MLSHVNTNRLRGKIFKIINKSKDGVVIKVGSKSVRYSWVEFKDNFDRNPENPNEVSFKEVKLAKMEKVNTLLHSLAMSASIPNFAGNQLASYLLLGKGFQELQELTEVSPVELIKAIQQEVKFIKKVQEQKLLNEFFGKPKGNKKIHKYDGDMKQDSQNTINGREMGLEGFSMKAILSSQKESRASKN